MLPTPRLGVLCALLLLAVATDAANLSGIVVDSDGHPVPDAYLTVTDETGRVLIERRSLPLSRIAVPLQGNPRALTCEVVAAGYVSRRVTVEIVNEKANVGRLVMKRAPGLRLSRLFPGKDGKSQWIDVLVFNDSDEPAIIESLALRASNEDSTKEDCLDLVTPDVVINVGEIAVTSFTAPPQPMDTIVWAAGREVKAVSAGKVFILKCFRVRLEIDTTLLYRVAPKEGHKIRMVLPTKAADEKTDVSIDLSQWKLKRLTLRLAGGRQYATP